MAALFIALVVAVSGVLTVPGVSSVVVGISGMISTTNLIRSSSQVPGVGVGEVALPGVLVVVHPRRDLLHRDRDDPGLEDWMWVDAANVLVVLLTSLPEIFPLSPLVPRVEVPGSVNAFWVTLFISKSGLLKTF